MSSAVASERYVVAISDKSRIGYFLFTMPDIIFCIVTFIVLQTVLSFLPYMPFWGPQVIPIAIIAVLLFRAEDARLYYEYGVLMPASFWIWNKRGIIWKPPQGDIRKARWLKSQHLETILEERRAAIKFKVDGIQMKDRTLGILHNWKTKLDTFVIVGDGSPNALQDMMAQLNGVMQHGEVIKRNAITPMFKVRWSYVFRRSPNDPENMLDTYATSLDGNVYFPPAHLKPEHEWTVEDRVDMFLNSVSKTSLDDADALVGNVTMAVVITIERKGTLYRRKRTTELSEDELARQPVLDLERGIVSDLANIAKVQNPRSLSQAELALAMRQSWDVTNLKEYYRQFHKNQREQLAEDEQEAFAVSHWPTKLIWAGPGKCIMDDTHHAMIKVTSNPREIPPNFWHRIMKVRYTRQAKPIWTTVTFCGETVSLKGEAFALSRGIPLMRMVRSWITNASYQSEQAADRDRAMVDRHTTIYRDQNYQLANMRLIKVSATDDASLREAVQIIKDEMGKDKLRGRVIKRRALQLRALWSSAGIPLL